MLNYRALDSAFRALVDPTRRAIIERLGDGDVSVSDLAEPLPMSLAAAQPVAALTRAFRGQKPRLLPACPTQLKGWPAASAAGACSQLNNRDQIHLGSAHEVVFRQSADGVGGESDAAVVVADLEVGVVILDVGDVRQRVHEAHGAIEVPESELAPNGVRGFSQYPRAGDLREQLLCLGLRQRRGTAFAGLAFACG